jgi:hypothetical protein
MGAELIRTKYISLIIIVFLALGYVAFAQQQQQQPAGPTVEQRLGSAIAALIVENARLATELENARQMMIKLQADQAKDKQEATTARTTDFTTPSFNFNDGSMTGASFANTTNDVAFSIGGLKQPTTAVPNGTGGYTALFANQTCQGVSSSAYCGSTEMQAIARFNNLGSQNGGNIWASNPVVIIDAATACQFPPCGIMNINSVLGQEIDLDLNQAVSIKEALRIADLSSGAGIAGDANNSAAIQVQERRTSCAIRAQRRTHDERSAAGGGTPRSADVAGAADGRRTSHEL